ncbi:MAG: asparagine synthase [Solirubrobacterales bacterium]|nr:asparagine synthase [Solirubrobacterales bacterium]
MALAREAGGPVAAVNCSLPDEPRADEGHWAQLVAGSLGIELETVSIDSAAWRSNLVGAVHSHEYPLASAGSVPIASMAAAARNRGIKVLLTGEGADELFAGYPYFHPHEERAFLPRRRMIKDYLSRIARRRFPWKRALQRLHLRRLEPVPDRAPESARALEEALERARRAYSHHSGPRLDWEVALVTDISCSSFGYLLNRMDKDAMSRSVETRVPFLDPDVVSLALNLPLEARTGPRLKGILGELGARHLPRAIVERPKYPGMMFNWTRLIEQAADPGFVRSGLLRELLGASEAEWDDLLARSPFATAIRFWTAEIWARLFLEGESVEAVERELWL